MKVVIFTNSNGWHERRLIEAFHSAKAEPILASLAECGFTDRNQFGGLQIPGLDNELPAAVFVRGIAAGTFEQVTLRLDFLHALTEMSVKVVNSARVIERTVDKARTSHLLNRSGIASLPAWTFESRARAAAIVAACEKRNRKLVLKPLFGSRGRGLRLIGSQSDLPTTEEVSGVYYLQEFVPTEGDCWRDWRVMVVGGRSLCAMERRSDSWITNRAQGARCLPATLPPQALDLAERAVAAVGADYAGVDLIHTQQEGWRVIEINGVPAWRGLQDVSEPDIARSFAQLVASAVSAC